MVTVTDALDKDQIERLSVQLSILIWERWHGPLAHIPGTHEDTVNQLRQMIQEINHD